MSKSKTREISEYAFLLRLISLRQYLILVFYVFRSYVET